MMMGDPPVFVYGPYYFGRDDDGEPTPTTPTEVGSRKVHWTVFGFTTISSEGAPLHTSAMLTGEHYTPPDPVIREAQMQLYGAVKVYGAQSVETVAPARETDSAGGVTIHKEPG